MYLEIHINDNTEHILYKCSMSSKNRTNSDETIKSAELLEYDSRQLPVLKKKKNV